jgi:hypothetical protein
MQTFEWIEAPALGRRTAKTKGAFRSARRQLWLTEPTVYKPII